MFLKTMCLIMISYLFSFSTGYAKNAYCLFDRDTRKIIEDLDGYKGEIRKLLSKYENNISSKIETVPPDISKWIEEEKENALLNRNKERFDLVANHRYYYPHEFGKNNKILVDNMKAAINSNSFKEIAISLAVALSRYSIVEGSIEEYIEDRRKNKKNIDNFEDIYFHITVYHSDLYQILHCTIMKLENPR